MYIGGRWRNEVGGRILRRADERITDASAESGHPRFNTTATVATQRRGQRAPHETQISFRACRLVCTDCSDRSHPSHIGFVAGNRIHVHLCCYYRAIGVFVYWLTKSTDIESDNRHYSQFPPSLPNPDSLPHNQNLSGCLCFSFSCLHACMYK